MQLIRPLAMPFRCPRRCLLPVGADFRSWVSPYVLVQILMQRVPVARERELATVTAGPPTPRPNCCWC